MNTALAVHPRQGRQTLRGLARLLAKDPIEKLPGPAHRARSALRTTVVVASMLLGAEKFFNWMNLWPKYLWAGLPYSSRLSPQGFMYGLGGIEVGAGLGALARPRLVPYLVAAWAGGTITKAITSRAHTQVFRALVMRAFEL